MFKILITKTDDIDAFMQSDEFKSFDDHCREYQEQVVARVMAPLNPLERIEFMAWWGGMQWEGYWETRSEASQNAILTAISWGLG